MKPAVAARDGADRRVVITGVGIVNSVCPGAADVGTLLESDRSGIGPVTGFSTEGFPSHRAAELPPTTLRSLVDPTEARRMSRVSQLTLAAARLAWEDAGLRGGGAADLALVVGTEFGDLRSTEEFAAGYVRRGVQGLSPLVFPSTVMNTMAAVAAIALGIRGPSITVNARGVAGELAVARAAALVAAGRAPAALAGGVDEISPSVFDFLCRQRALSPRDGGEEIPRPFDRRANGPVRGEGAVFLVLESLDSARLRGVRVLAEVRAAVWRSGSRARAVGLALESAGLTPADVGWVYASAPGDPAEDRAEMASIRESFGDALPLVTSLAPLAGAHGGLGALGVAAAAWTARTGRLPGIASLEEPVDLARGLAAGPGVHPVPVGPGLVSGSSRRGDRVALLVAPLAA
jgi:3-oxoacyl-(acyl-carrier-protein) synthase